MFYKVEIEDHIRVPANLFHLDKKEAIVKQIKKKFEGYVSKDIGIVIDVSEVRDVREGVIIPGDGAAYYKCQFVLITYNPEMHEIVTGKVKDIAEFGVFLSLGPVEGMVHVSQTIDDFVSFSKEKVLTGKESKKTVKVGDMCRAKIIAVSYKDLYNPKLGLTMRQKGLGKLEWLHEEVAPEVKS
jgi:DNA-directed RNA polymerase subunit E'